MSFIELLKQAQAAAEARNADPWRIRLEGVRGKVGDDGVERISTQALFDLLEVPQGNRGAGWIAVKARGLTQAGYKEQVRGYARDKRLPLG